MKLFFTLLLLCVTSTLFAQYNNSFDHKYGDSLAILIDTNFHNNKWQIGHPHKTLFDSSDGNVIVTDTTNYYSPNDTSIFYFKMPSWSDGSNNSSYGLLYNLRFDRYVNIDSGDIAVIQQSIDTGKTWNTLTKPFFDWNGTNNTDSGVFLSTDGWKSTSVGVTIPSLRYDTILFRVMLISCSDTTNREGWMIDNIHAEYIAESVAQINNNNIFSTYPNPVTNKLYIKRADNKAYAAIIYKIDGSLVYKNDSWAASSIDVSQLANGIYIIQCTNDQAFSAKRFIIDR